MGQIENLPGQRLRVKPDALLKFLNTEQIHASATIIDMHSAVGSDLGKVRDKMKTAKLERLMAERLEAGVEKTDNCDFKDQASKPVNLHQLHSKEASDCTSDYKALVGEHNERLDQLLESDHRVELLEMMRKTDADKLKTSRLEIISLHRERDDFEAEKDLEISRLNRDSKVLEHLNESLQGEVAELKSKLQKQIKNEKFLLAEQAQYIHDLETVLRQAKRQIDIKMLEFKALAKEHESVNRTLVMQEQMIENLKKPCIVK